MGTNSNNDNNNNKNHSNIKLNICKCNTGNINFVTYKSIYVSMYVCVCICNADSQKSAINSQPLGVCLSCCYIHIHMYIPTCIYVFPDDLLLFCLLQSVECAFSIFDYSCCFCFSVCYNFSFSFSVFFSFLSLISCVCRNKPAEECVLTRLQVKFSIRHGVYKQQQQRYKQQQVNQLLNLQHAFRWLLHYATTTTTKTI